MAAPANTLRTQAAQIGPRDYVVTVWAEAESEEPPDLGPVIDEILRHRPEALVLDVRAVAFLDSATVDAVGSSARKAREAGAAVILVADRRELGMVGGADGFDRFVEIRPTLASAIEALRGRSA